MRLSTSTNPSSLGVEGPVEIILDTDKEVKAHSLDKVEVEALTLQQDRLPRHPFSQEVVIHVAAQII